MAKIILIDDDLDLCEMIRLWFIREEHALTVIHEGYAGLQELKENDYDVAILDWDLPDLKGIDLLSNYRLSGGITPIILLTGRTSLEDKESGLDCGADDYLTKPFHMKELSARIRALIRRSNVPPPKSPSLPMSELLIGSTIGGEYKILSVVGGGGYGLIYKAEQASLKRMVAVKLLFPQLSVRENFVNRFQQEARAASKLSHPNIVAVYDYSTNVDMPYLVMEYIAGTTLDEVLTQQGAMNFERSVNVFFQICDAMTHAHQQGIIHRDLKPSNIMLVKAEDGTEQVKIVDFGIAKPLAPDEDYRKLTLTGEVFGSPAYMSPEQCLGLPVDLRCDIYSMGCLMYETLSGKPAFSGNNPLEVIQRQISDMPNQLPLPRGDSALTEPLQAVVFKALAKKADRRYQTMQALKDDLAKVSMSRTV